MQVTVEIPDQFFRDIVPEGSDAARALFEEAVAGAYRARRLSIKDVRILLGYETRMEVEPFLLKHEIYDYTYEDFEKDFETTRHLFPRKAGS